MKIFRTIYKVVFNFIGVTFATFFSIFMALYQTVNLYNIDFVNDTRAIPILLFCGLIGFISAAYICFDELIRNSVEDLYFISEKYNKTYFEAYNNLYSDYKDLHNDYKALHNELIINYGKLKFCTEKCLKLINIVLYVNAKHIMIQLDPEFNQIIKEYLDFITSRQYN